MLGFLHKHIVADESDGHAEYAALALVCVVLVNISAAAAVRRGRSVRVFEAASGAGVSLACMLTLMVRGTYFTRQVIATVLMAVWGTRLSVFLFYRSAKKEGLNVVVRIVWSMLCATPVIICNTRQDDQYENSRVGSVAATVAVASIVAESIADVQKFEWHLLHPSRPGKADIEPPVCGAGLWAWCRHPNLFFELVFQWCIYAIVRPVERPTVVVCPLILTLMIVSLPGGVVFQERERRKLYGLYPSYMRYVTETPVFFPFPLVRTIFRQCAPHCTDTLCLEMEPVEDF